MITIRSLLNVRALVCVLLAAAPPITAQTAATPPPALPAWPDEAPSVYSSAKASAIEPAATPQVDFIQPASFATPPVAMPSALPTDAQVVDLAANPISESSADDPRRLIRRSSLPRAARHADTSEASESLPSFGLPIDSMYTTIAALAVIIGLFLLSAALVRRGARKSNSLLPEEVVSVLGRVPLATRQFAELVRVGNKLVLVSITPSGAEPLTEITDPAEIDRLLGLCKQHSKGSSTAEFDQVFRQLAEETSPAGFLGHEAPRVEARLGAGTDVFAAYRGGAQRA